MVWYFSVFIIHLSHNIYRYILLYTKYTENQYYVNNKCILKCIKKIELEKNTFLAASENNSSNNKIKFSQIILDLDFHTLDFKDKSSLKINSPPWIYHKISTNYSYHNLIKIIKSNT